MSGTDENRRLLDKWEKAARGLSALQEADIPVLWRPYHEFDGQWFWWGKNTDGSAFSISRKVKVEWSDDGLISVK